MFTPDDLEFYCGILEMKATKELYMILSFLNNAYTYTLEKNEFFLSLFFQFSIIRMPKLLFVIRMKDFIKCDVRYSEIKIFFVFDISQKM